MTVIQEAGTVAGPRQGQGDKWTDSGENLQGVDEREGQEGPQVSGMSGGVAGIAGRQRAGEAALKHGVRQTRTGGLARWTGGVLGLWAPLSSWSEQEGGSWVGS